MSRDEVAPGRALRIVSINVLTSNRLTDGVPDYLKSAGANLDSRSTAAPWMPTWKVGSPLAIPIDHALATKALAITKREVGPDIGSDHRPLLIEVGFVK